MKKTIVSTTNFVRRNKKTIALAAITIPVIYLQGKALNNVAEFLEEKGLYTEYYGSDED